MNKYDFVIIGLGNPGEKYKNNRHNIGWMILDEFALRQKVNYRPSRNGFDYLELNHKGKNLLFVKPTTFMNHSGDAVAHISKKYSIEPENFIVIVDEYNFEVGKIHLKNSGSSGGHNGISSIIEKLESSSFYRLRCGIGKEFAPGEMVSYVLADFPHKDKENLTLMINHAIDAIYSISEQGVLRSMQLINSGKLWQMADSNEGK